MEARDRPHIELDLVSQQLYNVQTQSRAFWSTGEWNVFEQEIPPRERGFWDLSLWWVELLQSHFRRTFREFQQLSWEIENQTVTVRRLRQWNGELQRKLAASAMFRV